MSTCPGKDIHSLYADNELQEPFKEVFKKHIKECPRCQKLLKNYSVLTQALKADVCTKSFSQQELDKGYVRLKARLSYKTVVMPAQPFSVLALSVKMVPAAAALALAVILPLRFGSKTHSQPPQNTLTRAAVLNAELIQNRGIVASGAVPAASLASALGTDYTVNINMPKLTEIDVFKPEFSLANTTQIQIPLSGVSQMPFIQAANTKLFPHTGQDSFK